MSEHRWQNAVWIWHDEPPVADGYFAAFFRGRITVANPRSAWIYVAAKGGFVLHINGREIADEEPCANYRYDVSEALCDGQNVIALSARCERDTPTGLLVYGCVTDGAGKEQVFHTDTSWRVSKHEPTGGWREADFDDGEWPRSHGIETYLAAQDWLDGQMPLIDSNDINDDRKTPTDARPEFAALMAGLDSSRFDDFVTRHCPDQRQIEAERIPVFTDGGLFPVACRLTNGDVLVVGRGGASHVGLRGRLDIARSSDGGRTWSDPVTALDSDADERNPAIGQMPDGSVVLAGMTATYTLEQTVSAARCGVKITRSRDGGRTWEPPQVLHIAPFETGSPYAKIVVLPDGTALLPIYSGDGSVPVCGASWSRDNGRTWSGPQILYRGTNETSLLCFDDGELLALGRVARGWLELRRSADGGKTWSDPQPFSHKTSIHPGDLILLPGDRVLATYGHRIFPYGCRARISSDRGRTWSDETVVAGDALNWDCGYPSSVALDGGDMLSVYYATASRSRPELGVHCMGVIWRP
jgi:sialidase-1